MCSGASSSNSRAATPTLAVKPSDLERNRLDALAQALADLIGLGQVAVRHHHHDLLAAKPAGEI